MSYTENKLVTNPLILSTTAKFYDPLGLLSPAIVPLKCMFQELCEARLGWDAFLQGLLAYKQVQFLDIIFETWKRPPLSKFLASFFRKSTKVMSIPYSYKDYTIYKGHSSSTGSRFICPFIPDSA